MVKSMATWLNRVLAMAIQDQTLLFQYFSETYDAVIDAAKTRGDYDQGITSLQAKRVSIAKRETIHTDPFGALPAHMHVRNLVC